MDIDELARRGLYDPDADGAADQLEMIRYLLGAGITPELLAGVRGGRALRDRLADYRLLGDGPRYSPRRVAADMDAELEALIEVLASAGLPMPGPDVANMTEAEKDVMAAFFAGAELFGEEALLRFTRVVAGSVARISEAAVAMFGVNVEDPLVSGGGGELELTQAADRALIALGTVPTLFDTLFRRHAVSAIRRLGTAHADLEGHDEVMVTVGFADLVGSTSWTQRQGPRELSAALGRFDRLAQRALHGEARVVKTIGDEVMFVTVNAADGCRTALSLISAVHAEPSLPGLRAGLAAGPVAAHDGDYFGVEVNRAARLVHAGEPGMVVVSTGVAELADADPDLRFESLGPRTLIGFDEPVEAVAVTWADARQS